MRAGLSGTESMLLSAFSASDRTVFGLQEVISQLRCSYDYAKVLVDNMVRKRWIVRLKRGVYLIVPLSAGVRPMYTEHEFFIASKLVSPYYVAYWSALNFHGLTEQTPFTVFVATTKRAASRSVLGVEYRFVTLSKGKFFGFEEAAIGSHRVNVSDLEKTIADSLDHPEYCGGIGEAAKALWNARGRVSFERVIAYAGKMGNGAVAKRLGFLVETLGIDAGAGVVPKIRRLVTEGVSALEPSAARRGRYLTRWNLLVNINGETLEQRGGGL